MKKSFVKNKPASLERGGLPFVWGGLAIPIISWLIFWLFANIYSFRLAFVDRRTELFTLQNFADTFYSMTHSTGNDSLLIALKNTMIYFVGNIGVTLPISMIIAFFIYKKIPGFSIFRVLIYLPAVINGMVFATAYSEIISPLGPLGIVVDKLGGSMQFNLFDRPETATWTILVFTLFTSFGGSVLLFSGTMSRIPPEIFEALKLDGCPPFTELVRVILPLIWPTFSTQLIFAFTGILLASGPILLFKPDGGAGTTTISFWIFLKVYGESSTGQGNVNMVSAAGIVFTTITVPIILAVRWLIEKVPAVEY